MKHDKKSRPGGGGFSTAVLSHGRLNHNAISKRRNWRDALPHPADYYPHKVTKLSRANSAGWAHGICPFHDDRDASFSVQLIDPRGGWKCFAGCGSGDLVAFHMRLCGLSFRDAVEDLARGAYGY